MALGLFVLFLTGCSSLFNVNSSDVDMIEIFESEDWEKASEEPHVTMEESSDINTLVRAMDSANEYNGEVDMGPADFEAVIIFEDESTRNFYLWLSAPRGAVSEIGEQGVYQLSERSTQNLKGLIGEET